MKQLMFVIAFITCMTANAQKKVDIKWSPEIQDEKNEILGRVIFTDEKFIYVTVEKFKTTVSPLLMVDSKGKVTPGIIKLDHEMNIVQRENYPSSEEKLDYKFEGIYYYGGIFTLFVSKEDKQAKLYEVLATKINMETLKPEGAPKSIISLPRMKADVAYAFKVSDDSSRFIVFARQESVKKSNVRIAYKVLDNNLNTVTEKNETTSRINEEYSILDVNLDKNGNVYYLAKDYIEGSGGREKATGMSGEKKSGYEVVVKRFSADGKTKDYKIDLDKQFIEDYMLSVNNKGDLLVFGLYEQKLNDGIKGYFFSSLSGETGEVLSTYKFKFPDSFISRINDIESDGGRKEAGISAYFQVTDFLWQPDGNMYVILEKNFQKEVQGKSIAYTQYHSHSIIALKLDSTGKEKWFKLIPKYQLYNDLTSYLYNFPMVLDDKLMIFYNDKKKNLDYNLNSDEMPKVFNALKEMSLMQVTIDNTGKMTRKEFADSEVLGTAIQINYSHQLGEKKMLLYGYGFRSKINKLGVANFQ